MTEWIDQLQALADEYHFKLEDVPDIMEEYILIDNEAHENERTTLGKSVLKQLLEKIE